MSLSLKKTHRYGIFKFMIMIVCFNEELSVVITFIGI